MGLAIFGGLVWLTVLGFVFDRLKQRRYALAVRTWPSAPGVIVSNRAMKRYVGQGLMDVGEISYGFEVAGRAYTGGHVQLGDRPQDIHPLLAHYPVGRAVTVYYRPSDPRDCALNVTPRKSLFPHTRLGTALYVVVHALWLALATLAAMFLWGLI